MKRLKVIFSFMLFIILCIRPSIVNADYSTTVEPNRKLYRPYAYSEDTIRTSSIGWMTFGFYLTPNELPMVTETVNVGDKKVTGGNINPKVINEKDKGLVLYPKEADSSVANVVQVLREFRPLEGKKYYDYYMKYTYARYLAETKLGQQPNDEGFYELYSHKIYGIGPSTLDEVKAKSSVMKTIGVTTKGVYNNYLGFITDYLSIKNMFGWNDTTERSFLQHFNQKFKFELPDAEAYISVQTRKGEALGGVQVGSRATNSEGKLKYKSSDSSKKIVKYGVYAIESIPPTIVTKNNQSYYLAGVHYEEDQDLHYPRDGHKSCKDRARLQTEYRGKLKKSSFTVSEGLGKELTDPEYLAWYSALPSLLFGVGEEKTTLFFLYEPLPAIPPPVPDVLVPGVKTPIETQSLDFKTPYTKGSIYSNTFDVEDGIPSSEKVNSQFNFSNYQMAYKLIKYRRISKQTIPVKYTWRYSYQYEVFDYIDAKTGNIVYKKETASGSNSTTIDVLVEREATWWEVDYFELLQPTSVKFSNGSIGTQTITKSGNNVTASYIKSRKEADDDEIFKGVTVEVPLGTYSSSSTPSAANKTDAQSKAEAKVKQFKVANDTLIVNGVKVLDGTQKEKETPNFVKPLAPATLATSAFTKNDITIPANIKNTYYESEAEVTYSRVLGVEPKKKTTEVYEFDINGLNVHTPIAIRGTVSDSTSSTQLVTPSNSTNIVMGIPFTVSYNNYGEHYDWKGYGTKDYAKYVSSTQVKFGFDVMQGSTAIKANTWVSSSGSFTVPNWVNEDYYTVDFRAIAINGNTGEQELVNTDPDSYTVTDSVETYVSGRMYGFNVYDISDYPLWQTFFRTSKDTKTGNKYTVGTKDLNGSSNGQTSKYTLPLMDGKHPTIKNVGSLKTGYKFRFNLQTLGDMDSAQGDYLVITPKFYFVKKNGTGREEVDVYYDETFNGKKQLLVKVGSASDNLNQKKLSIGSDLLMVPSAEVKTTAGILGMTYSKFKNINTASYSFNKINLTNAYRTFIGSTSRASWITENQAVSSVQNWHGEYYLPSSIYAVSKGYDVLANTKGKSITFKESFWKKDGYIIVNFDIVSYKNYKPNLTYRDGSLNMWNREGYNRTQTDYNGATFTLQYGDVMLYKLTGTGGGKYDSASADYSSGGTH